MSKFKLTQTAAEVQDILNNSLQKPTGLAKTKLVGVGVNGQENIEIGDNLTLANGKLSAAAGGGGGSSARHVYSVIIEDSFHYEVYTSKNYDFQIGKLTNLPDFKTNQDYNELRLNGNYPVSGYYRDSSDSFIICCRIQINGQSAYV